MADLAQIIDKVKALRARAGDAASSSAEVEAAAKRAAKLIAEHELTEGDLREATTDAIHAEGFGRGRRSQPVHLTYCAHAISCLSETKGLWRNGGELRFFGFPEDVAFALYLVALVDGSAKRAWSIYAKRRAFANSTAMRRARQDFLEQFGLEAASCFWSAAIDRDAARRASQGSSTDLVVIKHQVIDDYISANMAEPGPPKQERKKRRRRDISAMLAGARAGRCVNPHRPIEDATDGEDSIPCAS